MGAYSFNGKLFSGSALEVARQCRAMTRKELAEAVGMPLRRIADFETDRKAPSAEEVLLFAAVLGMSYGYFSHEIQRLDWRNTSLRW